MDEDTQEIIDELTAQVEEHRDAARTLRTHLAALRRTHAARIKKLSAYLERLEASLASTVTPRTADSCSTSKPVRASDEELQAERPDLMSIEHPDDLKYLVRRFTHETGVRVGAHSNYVEALRGLVGTLMSIRERQRKPGD